MPNFVKTFSSLRFSDLENSINEYARKNSLNIVSVSITKAVYDNYCALVVFEKRSDNDAG